MPKAKSTVRKRRNIDGKSQGKPDLSHIASPLRPLAVPVAGLNLDPSNARKHPERNLEAIKASLAKFGQRAPLVVQKEGMIVRAGNGRLVAAKELGWSHVAAIVLEESNIDANAFAIADNRTAELAEWDKEILAELLESMDKEWREFAGFDEKEFHDLLAALEPKSIEGQVPIPTENENVQFQIIVRCRNNKHQRELLERFSKEGIKCWTLNS